MNHLSPSFLRTSLNAIRPPDLNDSSVEVVIAELAASNPFQRLVLDLARIEAFSPELAHLFKGPHAVRSTTALRQMKSCLNLRLGKFFYLLADMASSITPDAAADWYAFADRVNENGYRTVRLKEVLLESEGSTELASDFANLENKDPHAIYPTSEYRSCTGSVSWSDDDQDIEGVMSTSTMTEIHILEGVLEPEETLLRRIYKPLGRCICLIDHNVDNFYRKQIEAYFSAHGIDLVCLAYRAMEVDKSIRTVEKILGDFKRIGVSRNEPVLIAGGGVLADVGGLACGLFHRNTPYIMLATSIVSGIDAGPSPRTCCDGFGYKNLFGAYHAPVMTITDRTFFRSLHTGWLRHGIAEIIKMAVVKDRSLFELLEATGPALIDSKFATVPEKSTPELVEASNRVLGAAMRSYVESEYGNLYETHQCRPHAYGHTWSPGFEIAAGLLHGHAVACGMGFGAFLSYRNEWIGKDDLARILNLISLFELSLWHDILDDVETVWKAQVKMVEKRGGNLAAPIPKKTIGQCGYLNHLSREELAEALEEYHDLCRTLPRKGHGIEPLCRDVGLEDPSVVHTECTGHPEHSSV